VAEKVGALNQGLDDPAFPHVTYRCGATPVLRSTGIRVQTLVVATQAWELSPAQIAAEYGLTQAQVKDALSWMVTPRCSMRACRWG
jgi:uncharacterized protein (DUF433 family)